MENRRPPDRELRRFAITVFLALSALGSLVVLWLIRPVLQFTGCWPL